MYGRFARRTMAASALLLMLAALFFLGLKSPGAERNNGGNDEAASTAAAKLLNRPYADWRQQEIPFGYSSFYLAPWKAYMDTWDAKRYLETLGIVFNVSTKEADATAALLSEAGFSSARVEIGWGNVSYEDELKLREPQGQNFQARLKALKKYGIRPIILLNANSGYPVPLKQWEAKLKSPAKAGSRTIAVDKTSGIVPDYTGLTGQAYQTMFPVITKVDAKTGRLELSAPLPKDLKAGPLTLVLMKYRPLSGTIFSDGTPNPASRETIDGWKKYVRTVTIAVKKALGTTGTDAGFDLEVWNEMTFGSQFLDIKNYYDPPLEFSEYPSYTLGERTQEGSELLLPLTIDYVNNPANGLPGVRVISGFSNQRPWENGTELFPGQTGFSRHYYTGYTEVGSVIRANPNASSPPRYLSATGEAVKGDSYVPAHISAMPERWFYAYQTEFVIRDLQPFPGPWSQHFRYANPGNGHQSEVWMTETNWWRWPFASQLIKTAGTTENDPKLRALMQEIGAKTTLRLFTFYSHKGVKTVNVYAAKAGDLNYGVVSDAFFAELAKNGYRLTDPARRSAGPQIKALTRLAKLMRSGVPIDNPRPLQVTGLKLQDERLVMKGDGTPEHPDVYDRDDFAVLPFQLNDRKFAIGYYVVTRDITQTWQSAQSLLQPLRYSMPLKKVTLTLNNVAGDRSSVYSWDPMNDSRTPVPVTHKSANSLTVELESADYPRFLILEENRPGPVISGARLELRSQDAIFTFQGNAAGKAEVTWGAYPIRTSSAFREQYYTDRTSAEPSESRNVGIIHNLSLPERSGVWSWTGTIVPKYSELYSFILNSDSCEVALKIDGLNIISGCGKPVTAGEVKLYAGEKYQLELVYMNRKSTPHFITLYWASANQPKEPVTVKASAEAGRAVVDVVPNQPISVKLPGFRSGDGVKVTLDSGELQTRFPQWNYDVRGVWWGQTK